MNLVPFVRYSWDWEGNEEFDLNPTGRWKIEKYNDKSILYLEHRHSFLLFPYKKWIQENDILFREEPDIFVNNCSVS